MESTYTDKGDKGQVFENLLVPVATRRRHPGVLEAGSVCSVFLDQHTVISSSCH